MEASSPVVTTVVNSEQPPAPTPTPSSVALPPAPAGPSNPPNAPSYSDDSSRTIVTTVVNSEQPPVPTLTLSTVALPSSSTREKSPAEEPTTPPLPAPSMVPPLRSLWALLIHPRLVAARRRLRVPPAAADCGPAPETTLSSTTTETHCLLDQRPRRLTSRPVRRTWQAVGAALACCCCCRVACRRLRHIFRCGIGLPGERDKRLTIMGAFYKTGFHIAPL